MTYNFIEIDALSNATWLIKFSNCHKYKLNMFILQNAIERLRLNVQQASNTKTSASIGIFIIFFEIPIKIIDFMKTFYGDFRILFFLLVNVYALKCELPLYE